MKKAPEFVQEEIFKILLWRKNAESVSVVLPDVGVNVGVNAVLMLIEKNPGINVLTMTKDFNVSQRTIECWINQLKRENKIEFKGASKTGGYWKI